MIAALVMLLAPCQPIVGRPSNFVGGVGSFRLEASIQPTSGDLSTVFTVTLRLTGSGDVSRCETPDLSKQRSFLERFAPAGPPSKKAIPSGIEFSFPVRAKSAAVDSLPALSLAVWNPTASKPRYETLVSQRTSVVLQDHSEAKGEEFSQTEEIRGGFAHPGVLIALGAACLAVGGAGALATLRRRRPASPRQEESASKTSAPASPPSDPSAVDARDRIAVVLGLPAGRRTTSELLNAAEDVGVDVDILERLRDALRERDRLRFGPAVSEADSPLEAVASLVEQWAAYPRKS